MRSIQRRDAELLFVVQPSRHVLTEKRRQLKEKSKESEEGGLQVLTLPWLMGDFKWGTMYESL